MQLIVAITGGSGVVYGIKTLEILRDLKMETHLLISEWGEKNIKIETDKSIDYVKSLATKFYDKDNMVPAISSGSFKTDGMIVVPCSMKTLSSIANGYDENLISRGAGVCIKESRKIVIVPRETPLSKIHLQNMIKLVEIGVIVLPAMPGFYHKPKTIDDLIIHIVGKILINLGLNTIFSKDGEEEIIDYTEY